MHRCLVWTGRINVLPERGDQPSDIRRTAWAAMPGPATMPAAAGEWVLVEEMLAVECKAAERAVIERELHHVGIARVALDQQHAMRPEDQPDRGAGLRITGFVRQIVIGGEALV